AYPFRDLGPRAFESTLDMLSGRYPSDEFAELRPRIVWDRVEGRIRGRAGAQRLAVTSGGTIPDRGLYTVNLLDDGRRVGELDERAVRNLLQYLEDQAQSAGLPDDRTIVVERFRDELGDWRVCVLTPLGERVHAPWALAAAARLRERTGLEVASIHTDDGFALRFPDADRPPDLEDILLEPEEVTELVTAQLHGSALFASRVRENAARALLL